MRSDGRGKHRETGITDRLPERRQDNGPVN